jgi:hypothetical protein
MPKKPIDRSIRTSLTHTRTFAKELAERRASAEKMPDIDMNNLPKRS